MPIFYWSLRSPNCNQEERASISRLRLHHRKPFFFFFPRLMTIFVHIFALNKGHAFIIQLSVESPLPVAANLGLWSHNLPCVILLNLCLCFYYVKKKKSPQWCASNLWDTQRAFYMVLSHHAFTVKAVLPGLNQTLWPWRCSGASP